ncbi:MAG: response regulator transcription factor [Oscillospiraceae bacterium]|nr:response regulator transcription factor [Oscillospiraceae bacterium]
MNKIYVVEDDEHIQEIVIYALNSAGFDASGYETGKDLYIAMESELPALVILDIMLPDEDGLTILRKLRSVSKTQKLPIIMLTAKSDEFDKVKGLDMGADDYISKPFGVMELISRVNAVLRRSETDHSEKLELSGIIIDNTRREVSIDDTFVKLTFKEFELLYYLMLNSGLVLSRDQIMQTVWGFDFEGESRTVDMHIKTLRQKLGTHGGMIKTVRNVGYRIDPII